MKLEKRDAVRLKGNISDDGCTVNCIKNENKHQDLSSALSPQDNAIADTYGQSLVGKVLDSAMPYCQSGLRNRPCYEIMFNKYEKVINASGQASTPDATYKIKDTA